MREGCGMLELSTHPVRAEQHFLGLACLSPHHLAALVLFVEF